MLLKLDSHSCEVVYRVKPNQMSIRASYENVLFKSITGFIAHRNRTADLLFIKWLNLTLLLKWIKIEHFDYAVWAINKEQLAATVLDMQLSNYETNMLRHVVVELHLDLFAKLFAFVSHD
jgi:hypothetical protein